MRAKFICESITDYRNHKQAELSIPYSDDPKDNEFEDKEFSETTNNSYIQIIITNPNIMNKFIPGKQYYVDFTEVSK